MWELSSKPASPEMPPSFAKLPETALPGNSPNSHSAGLRANIAEIGRYFRGRRATKGSLARAVTFTAHVSGLGPSVGIQAIEHQEMVELIPRLDGLGG
jgi:hypothetical protein